MKLLLVIVFVFIFVSPVEPCFPNIVRDILEDQAERVNARGDALCCSDPPPRNAEKRRCAELMWECPAEKVN
jgi:hypothetical protein